MDQNYTKEQWWEEIQKGKWCKRHNYIGGDCNLKCPNPNCGSFGWYAPRLEPYVEGRLEKINPESIIVNGIEYKIIRKYRACKRCGFWQEVWGYVSDDNPEKLKPYKGTIRHHKSCEIKDTWGTFGENIWCEKCKDNIEELFPIDDPQDKELKESIDKIHKSLNL